MTSPGLGARVVTDTESQISGLSFRSPATTVLLPTPEGPERTVSRAGTPPPRTSAVPHERSADVMAVGLGPRARPWSDQTASDNTTELVFQRGALVRAQAADPARFGDAEPLHDLPGPNLADPRHGLEES